MFSTLDIATRVLLSVLLIFNTIGNVLVIVVVQRRRSMKTPMNYLLANLAVADLMVGLFMIPKELLKGTYRHPGGWVGDFLCMALTDDNLTWLAAVASVMTLVFIAWERYYAIIHPHSCRGRITARKLRYMILASWLIAIGFDLLELCVIRYDERQQSCIYDWSDIHWKVNVLLWNIGTAFVPVIIKAYLYGRVVYRLWFQKSQATEVSQRSLMLQRKRLTRIVLTITVINACCWLPVYLYYLQECFDGKTTAANSGSSIPMAYSFGIFLLLLNSTLNPVIFAAQDRKFRRHMWKALKPITKHCRVHQQVAN